MQKEGGEPLVFTGQETARKNSTLRLPGWHLRIAKKAGQGNLTFGVMVIIEEWWRGKLLKTDKEKDENC